MDHFILIIFILINNCFVVECNNWDKLTELLNQWEILENQFKVLSKAEVFKFYNV